MISILGISLDVETPYVGGHICTPAEAAALNRLLVRGTAKGLHKAIREACNARGYDNANEPMPQGMREQVESVARDYAREYAQGFSEGHERLRAIEVEARRIGLASLASSLYQHGRKIEDIEVSEREAKVNELSLNSSIRREAERRVDDTARLANAAHEELLAALNSDDLGH